MEQKEKERKVKLVKKRRFRQDPESSERTHLGGLLEEVTITPTENDLKDLEILNRIKMLEPTSDNLSNVFGKKLINFLISNVNEKVYQSAKGLFKSGDNPSDIRLVSTLERVPWIEQNTEKVYPTDTIFTTGVLTKNGRLDTLIPKGIILHHTGLARRGKDTQLLILTGTKPNGSYRKKQPSGSAHVLIDLYGNRTVLANPTVKTEHAGASRFGDLEGLNNHMIGVEFYGDTDEVNLTDALIKSFVEYAVPTMLYYGLSPDQVTTHEAVRDAYIEKYPDKKVKTKPDINEWNYYRILEALEVALKQK